MVDPKWPPFENKTLLGRHMRSSADVADLNGNIFGRIICPLCFVVIALMFLKLRGGGGIRPPPLFPPGPTRENKPGLKRVKTCFNLYCGLISGKHRVNADHYKQQTVRDFNTYKNSEKPRQETLTLVPSPLA